MGGFGAGCNTTVVFSLITSHFELQKQAMLGYVEAGIGVGLLLGPIVGSTLYEAGGFCCPFWTLGLAFMIMYPLVDRLSTLVQQCNEA